MLAVNYSTLRENFKAYCDKVTDDTETVIVTRKDNKNVVLMSLDEYNNIMENQYIMSNQRNYNYLVASKGQLEKGRRVVKTTEELEELEDE